MSAKCPKCEKLFSAVNFSEVSINDFGGSSWRGPAYACPYCHSALSIAIDPVALKTDTVNAVVAEIKRLLP